MKKLITYILLVLIPFALKGQDLTNVYSNKVCKDIQLVGNFVILIDSMAVVPGSFEITNLDTTYYSFDYSSSLLELKANMPMDVTYLNICYRRSFFQPTKRYEAVHYEENQAVTFTQSYQELIGDKKLSEVVDLGGINYSGTFGRGVTTGNNQSLTMQSNLNLQFSGYVTDSILVTAAITDNSIPFQPEGNTQKLQEFDQVFMKFEKNKQSLILGDHEIFRPDGYFLNFYKRAQGAYHQGAWDLTPNTKIKTKTGISVAKGKFNRNTITPKDGNQGPYRLRSQDGSLFFIIIANSERVYIDGQLLKRGENLDYVIDYNSGEVTFMPTKPINKDLRIIVEFESVDRNYVNPLIVQSTQLDLGKKFSTYINFYNNQDVGSQPLNINLSDEQKYYLDSIGDSVQYAFIDNFSPTVFDKTKIQYKRIDTVFDGNFYPGVFVRNNDPQVQPYSVSFTYIGPNGGDYTLLNDETNGKVFVWVPPIDGVSQGEYIAKLPLTTPKKQQMVNLGARYQIAPGHQIRSEVSMTNHDPNRYSSEEDNSHYGLGLSLDYDGKLNLNKSLDSLKKLKRRELLINVHAESLDAKFQPIVRYRNPEFERDWGGQNQADYTPSQELWTKGGVSYRSDKFNMSLLNEIYQKDTSFGGMRNSFNASFADKGWSFNTYNSLMTADRQGDRQRYFRPRVDGAKSFDKLNNLTLRGSWQREENAFRKTNDSLHLQSYSFDIIESGISYGSTTKTRIDLNYLQRKNLRPVASKFENQDQAHNFTLNSAISSIKNQVIQVTATYRILDAFLVDTNISKYTTQNTVGRLQYNGSFVKNLITQNLIYELGTGQEQKRTVYFTEVAAGQGQYYWNDYNGDSVAQLNEFEIALYPDQARYIKIFTPTNEFVNARYLNLNYTLNLDPNRIPSSENPSRAGKFVRRFSSYTSIQVSNKAIDDNTLNIYNPLYTPGADSNLIFANNAINQLVYFNKTSTDWGLTYNYQTSTNNSLLSYGVEAKQNLKHSLQSRVKISPSLNWKNSYSLLTMSAHTGNDGFGNRNYNLEGGEFLSSLNFNYNSKLRTSISWKYKNLENTEDVDYSFSNSVILESRANVSNKTGLQSSFTMDLIKSNVAPNTTRSYIMLSGLVPGTNFLWNVNLSQKILKNLEMLIQYNGRKPATTKIIHTGSFTMRAVF